MKRIEKQICEFYWLNVRKRFCSERHSAVLYLPTRWRPLLSIGILWYWYGMVWYNTMVLWWLPVIALSAGAWPWVHAVPPLPARGVSSLAISESHVNFLILFVHNDTTYCHFSDIPGRTKVFRVTCHTELSSRSGCLFLHSGQTVFQNRF